MDWASAGHVLLISKASHVTLKRTNKGLAFCVTVCKEQGPTDMGFLELITDIRE